MHSQPQPQPQLDVGQYVLTHRIGSGSFAQVYKAYHRSTRVEVAVKDVEKSKLNLHPQYWANMESEIGILTQLRHPNIVRLLDQISNEAHIYLVLEFCAGGDLASWMKQRKLAEAEAKGLARQLLQGVAYLQQQNIIHRDLKPQNLLLSPLAGHASTLTLKVADFGFARYIQPQSLAATVCGSPLYMAPEVLGCESYDGTADLWSMGCILYEMVVGQPPFTAPNAIQLLKRIQHTPVHWPDHLSLNCRHLLSSLLRVRPAERSSLVDLLAHPFWHTPLPVAVESVEKEKAQLHVRVLVIAQLANARRTAGLLDAALVLYVKALQVLRPSLNNTARPASVALSQYRFCLDQARACRTKLQDASDDAKVSVKTTMTMTVEQVDSIETIGGTECAESVMFHAALDSAKQGALQEMNRTLAEARVRYVFAVNLLQQLLDEAVTPGDHDSLTGILAKLRIRIEGCSCGP